MQQLKLQPNTNALVIVAHPDDETIWMGGMLAKYSKIDWTILSLCRASDSDRAPKFKKVCAHFNAQPIITDLDDEDSITFAQSLKDIKKIILAQISDKHFDYIFTHGQNGEYGHSRHRGAHQVVKTLIAQNKLHCNFAFCFNYCKISRKEFSQLRCKADTQYILKLTKQAWQAKKDVMSQIYGFDPNGIDANYCTKEEGFKKIKGKL
jgi:LmbE family N-acetylglucosaminyl deacetylase